MYRDFMAKYVPVTKQLQSTSEKGEERKKATRHGKGYGPVVSDCSRPCGIGDGIKLEAFLTSILDEERYEDALFYLQKDELDETAVIRLLENYPLLLDELFQVRWLTWNSRCDEEEKLIEFLNKYPNAFVHMVQKKGYRISSHIKMNDGRWKQIMIKAAYTGTASWTLKKLPFQVLKALETLMIAHTGKQTPFYSGNETMSWILESCQFFLGEDQLEHLDPRAFYVLLDIDDDDVTPLLSHSQLIRLILDRPDRQLNSKEMKSLFALLVDTYVHRNDDDDDDADNNNNNNNNKSHNQLETLLHTIQYLLEDPEVARMCMPDDPMKMFESMYHECTIWDVFDPFPAWKACLVKPGYGIPVADFDKDVMIDTMNKALRSKAHRSTTKIVTFLANFFMDVFFREQSPLLMLLNVFLSIQRYNYCPAIPWDDLLQPYHEYLAEAYLALHPSLHQQIQNHLPSFHQYTDSWRMQRIQALEDASSCFSRDLTCLVVDGYLIGNPTGGSTTVKSIP